MRLGLIAISATVVAIVASALLSAQFDPDRVIPGGGILVQGWTGKIDASSVRQGRMINDARFAQEGNALHVTTGPAATYWNLANTASGDYTVRATFLALRLLARLRFPLWRNTCLYRSIAQCLVLRSYGVPCRLRIGVTAPASTGEAARIDAHAWVERLDAGEPLPAPRGLALLR